MTSKITARYPSNIALVKYWGKYGNQLPCNASLSMTLTNAFTEVVLHLNEKQTKKPELTYLFEGKTQETFRNRILNYIQGQKEFSTLLAQYALHIESYNSFPHSAGIASSASAFAAIAAVCYKATNDCDEPFNQKASALARLGSGSACRSFYGPYACWGEIPEIKHSSNEYAVPVTEIHENFLSMKDAILIVEDNPKKVSSSVGHNLMKDHPFATARFRQGNKHCASMISVLKYGDFNEFISITEQEALSLHAMMMTSGDYYMLMKSGTIHIIEQVFQFRKTTGLPICFTLDAGPNVHLLYPETIQDEVHSLLEQNLRSDLKSVIFDQAGCGGSIF